MRRRYCTLLLLLLLPATAAGRQWTATEPPIDIAHIATGEINRAGQAVGYHDRPGGIDPPGARVRHLVQPPDAQGIYRALVAIRDPATGAWVDKLAPSTFFPDALTRPAVIAAILAAFRRSRPEPDGRFVGPSGSGFAIEGWYHQGRIVAAYPLRGPP